MVPVVGGGILVAGALIYFAVKLKVVYWVARDPANAGGVPTVDGIVFPPIVTAIGVSFIAPGQPAWVYIIVWLSSIAVAVVGFLLAFRLGSRRNSRQA